MEKLESHTSKEVARRSRLQRHAQRGKSIAAFCRDEAVSTASFPIWRSKPAAVEEHTAQSALPAAFIDLGTINRAFNASSPATQSRGERVGGLCVKVTKSRVFT